MGKSKITVPKIKRKSKGGKEKAENVEEVQPPMPEPKQEPIKLPDFLEIVEGENYFASNKGRLTNQEIVDNGLEFDRVIGNVWHYKFKHPWKILSMKIKYQ